MINKAKAFIKDYIAAKKLTENIDTAQTPTPTVPVKRSLQIFDFNQTNINQSNSTSTISVEFKTYQDILIDQDIDLFKFWREKSKKLPLLSSVARRLFCAQATSTPAERLFSASGYTVWDRRSNLKPEKVNKILVIRENILK